MNLWESSIAPLRDGKETGFAGERSEPIPPQGRYIKFIAPMGGTTTLSGQRPLSNFRTLRTFGPKGRQPFSLNLRNPFIYPIKRGISSLGDETITLAPWERRKGRVRKPQSTEMQGSPAFFAVSRSTSESPIYTTWAGET